MTKSIYLAKSVTFTGFPGQSPTTFIVDSFSITPATVELIEINDMQDADMVKDYAHGMVTLGDVTIVFTGYTDQIEVGSVGTASISVDGTSIFNHKVVLVESGTINATAKQPLKSQLKFKILKDDSNFAAPS